MSRVSSRTYRTISGAFRSLDIGNYWMDFWRFTWGKHDPESLDDQHNVQRSLDAIDDSLVHEAVPPVCNAMTMPEVVQYCWHFQCEKIFI